MSDIAGKTVTGDVIERVRADHNLKVIDICWYLGVYSPTYHRFRNEGDQPVDRVTAALVRFLADNEPFFFKHFSILNLFVKREDKALLQELRQAVRENPLKVGGKRLDISNPVHFGVVLMRTSQAAAHYESGKTRLVTGLHRWVGLIIYCLETGQSALIEKVILDEARASGISTDRLMETGWSHIS